MPRVALDFPFYNAPSSGAHLLARLASLKDLVASHDPFSLERVVMDALILSECHDKTKVSILVLWMEGRLIGFRESISFTWFDDPVGGRITVWVEFALYKLILFLRDDGAFGEADRILTISTEFLSADVLDDPIETDL